MTNETERLRKALDDAVRDIVLGKDVAVAFSGGLDSGIVASIAKKYARHITLYTVGSETSHDVREAETLARELDAPWVHIKIDEEEVIEGIKEMIRITGTKDPITLSFEVPLFFVAKGCEEEDIIGGQGADELFVGYSKYIGMKGDELREKIMEDIKKLEDLTLPYEEMVASNFGKRIHYPFLNDAVAKEAGCIGLSEPIAEDPMSRKRPLRNVADSIGYHSISAKEKKAAQYGSGTMKLIDKLCKKKNITYSQLIEEIGKEAE